MQNNNESPQTKALKGLVAGLRSALENAKSLNTNGQPQSVFLISWLMAEGNWGRILRRRPLCWLSKYLPKIEMRAQNLLKSMLVEYKLQLAISIGNDKRSNQTSRHILNTITPLRIDLTEYHAIPRFQEWLNHCKIEVPSGKKKEEK